MKAVCIGMMAATFVLGTGIFAIIYILAKIISSCVESVS